MLKHGNPQRQLAPSKDDILAIEAFKRQFQSEPATEITGGEYFRVESKKKDHFTEKIETNDYLEENLRISNNRILIQNMVIMSDQQLSYRVWLFGTDEFYADMPDRTKIIDFIDFDLVTEGKQYGNSGMYILAITDLNLLYNDLNQTNELHVAIQNLSDASKYPIDSSLIIQAVYQVINE